VFAVRMGRPLADNLRRALRGEPLRPYRPQRHWLALLATGDRHAIASRGPFGVEGGWVWRWKDWIDRRFMQRFATFPARTPAMMPAASSAGHRLALEPGEAQQALSVLAMRCGGCGAKVGADILSRVLARLDPVTRPEVLIGLDAPDDAAVIALPAGRVLVQSVDFFRAFIDDPWLFGQIAATHALSDLFAMGAEPHSAAALVTVPPGLDAKVEELLVQLMSGALRVLGEAGCALVGGHTAEGQELAIGFSVNGLAEASLAGLTRKRGLQPGDQLVLTKPLGTGTVLVAREALAAQAGWMDAAIASMLQSNRAAAHCLRTHGVRACTDVTGFGLLGHLTEMTRASSVGARLALESVPALPGALQSLAQGHVSSLHAGNRSVEALIACPDHLAGDPRLHLLFDPQTSGGLIAGVPPDRVQACLAALHAQGYDRAAVVGEVVRLDHDAPPIRLV
jgi:selenide,water dikinase